jgi:hypothetical protein
MLFEADSFWSPDQEPQNPPLTPDLILTAEQSLGVKLPSLLLDLLRALNGGYTRGFVFPTTRRTRWAADHVPFDELFGIGSSDPNDSRVPTNIMSTPYMTLEWGLPNNQVILSGDGHWITLDYRNSIEPTVAWIDTGSGQDVILAPTFGAFIDGLLPDDVVDEETGRLRSGGA